MTLSKIATDKSTKLAAQPSYVEFKICFLLEGLEDWSLGKDIALPTKDTILCFEGDYWRVVDVVQYAASVASGRPPLPPVVLVKRLEGSLPFSFDQ